MNFYYANKFSNNSTLTVNISKTFLEALPMDIKNNSIEHNISNIVGKIIDETRANQDDETLTSLYKELNASIYHMYGLNNKDIAKIES